MWLTRLLKELGVAYKESVKLYCYNKVAINIAHNLVHHDRAKHVEIDRHFIEEKIENGSVCMVYLPTKQQVVDLLTKSLSKHGFMELSNKLGLINICAQT